MVHAELLRTAKEVRFKVNGLQLAGLSWGDPGDAPCLALHGWLDNAASFACIGPSMDGYHIVALDLTGHGKSGWRSADSSYQIWDDLPEIVGVVDALGWDRFDLLGHSRGAIISALLASCIPERVQNLVMLDAVSPAPLAAEQLPQQLRKALLDKGTLLRRKSRVFPSVASAVDSRCRAGLSRPAAELLVRRGIRPCQQGLTWTTDPRLHGASAVKLTEGHIRAVLQGLDMPTLLMVAKRDVDKLYDMVQYAQQHIRSLFVEDVEGGHHFHMEAEAANVARHITAFLGSNKQIGK